MLAAAGEELQVLPGSGELRVPGLRHGEDVRGAAARHRARGARGRGLRRHLPRTLLH